MGLFDRFRRSDEEALSLERYVGMRIEIMNTSNVLLFTARVNSYWRGSMTLQPISVPRLPDDTYMEVLLRGYSDKEKQAIHLSGMLSHRQDGLWDVDDIELEAKDNDRAFFRQPTTISGEITPMTKNDGIYGETCRVINISAGGVCIFTDVELRKGDKILLKSNLLEGWSLTPLLCVVRRITKRKNGFEYGCEFIDLTPVTEDVIAKAIMQMQVKQRKMTESE